MATRLLRPRIRPMWRAGLRRGKVRDTMTAYLAEHPEFANRLCQLSRELDVLGWEPASMESVRQPFDYDPRMITPLARRIH